MLNFTKSYSDMAELHAQHMLPGSGVDLSGVGSYSNMSLHMWPEQQQK